MSMPEHFIVAAEDAATWLETADYDQIKAAGELCQQIEKGTALVGALWSRAFPGFEAPADYIEAFGLALWHFVEWRYIGLPRRFARVGVNHARC